MNNQDTRLLNIFRPHVEAVRYAGSPHPILRLGYIVQPDDTSVSHDDVAGMQGSLNIVNAAMTSGHLQFDPGTTTLVAPDFAAALQEIFPGLFNATDAGTFAAFAAHMAANPASATPPLSQAELGDQVLIEKMKLHFPVLAQGAPAAPALAALVAGVGWQWFPPGVFLEFTAAGTNALLAAIAGAGGAAPFLAPFIGAQAAGIVAAALAVMAAVIKVMQAASVKGAVKLKIVPVPFAPGYVVIVLPA